MDSTFVDIILPNFNKEKYLDEAINSILSQTHKNWKLYIIDDNSNDKSTNILKKYEGYKNIYYKKLKKNKGPSFCRNLGMRISSSNFIAFIDSDDVWKKNKLKDQLNFMIQNNYLFTFTDYTPFYQDEDKKNFLRETNIAKTFDLKKFTSNSSINTTTMIISRSILKNLKFKKIKKLEDYLFKCQILQTGVKANNLKQNLALYRILNKSRSSEKFKNVFYLWKINKKYLKFNIIKNLFSILMISFNSIKKYGFK
jgi:teichuronic acid biosynthesis glycosyltransferase TuaG